MPKRYLPEFRSRVKELVKAGRRGAEVAGDLGVSSQTIYNRRRQDEVDRGLRPGVSSSDLAELVAAGHRIAQLEAELAVARRAAELLREAVPPRRFEAVAVIASSACPPASWLTISRAQRASRAPSPV